MALVWAAGIIWFAYDVASSEESSPSANTSDQVTITDGSGAPVSPAESNELEQALKNF